MLFSTPVVRPGFLNLSPFSGLVKVEIKLSFLDSSSNEKISYNPCRIRILLFLSDSFGIETTNTFIHFRSYHENHTQFHIKMAGAKSIFWPVLRQKWCKIHTLWGRTYLYDPYTGSYKGVPLPPPLRGVKSWCFIKGDVCHEVYINSNSESRQILVGTPPMFGYKWAAEGLNPNPV